MWIKTIKGDYINTDAIAKLRIVSKPPFVEWHVEAMVDPYEELATLGEEFRTKEDAEAYLDAMVAFIDGKPQPAPKTITCEHGPSRVDVKTLKKMHEFIKDTPLAAMPNPYPQKSPRDNLLKQLREYTDDFETSNELDYLRYMITYANDYLEKNHD